MAAASFNAAETFWVPLAAGLVVSIAITVILMKTTPIIVSKTWVEHRPRKHRHKQMDWWRQVVWTSAAWTFKDSWATNITAVAGVLGIVAGSSTPASMFAASSGATPSEFVALGIIFGGTSVMAPLVYGALAKAPAKPESESLGKSEAKEDDLAEYVPTTTSASTTSPSQVQGSIGGLLVASAMTLFAAMGGLAAFATFVDTSSITGGERWCLISAAAVAAFFIGLYAVRSFRALAMFAGSDEPVKARPSLISGTQVSATL
jgi:hypothetical protein